MLGDVSGVMERRQVHGAKATGLTGEKGVRCRSKGVPGRVCVARVGW